MFHNSTGLNIPIGFRRLNAFPLDSSSIFQLLIDLEDYALNNPTAYSGQICSVLENEKVYIIQNDKTVKEILHGYATSGNLSGYYPINNPSGFVNLLEVSGVFENLNQKFSLDLQVGLSNINVQFPSEFSAVPSIHCNIDGGDDVIYQTLIKNKTISGCSISFSDTIQEQDCYLNIFISK